MTFESLQQKHPGGKDLTCLEQNFPILFYTDTHFKIFWFVTVFLIATCPHMMNEVEEMITKIYVVTELKI